MNDHYHNTLVPISRLPDSLLTDIFILIRDIQIAFCLPSCLNVSHVCTTWRNALSFAISSRKIANGAFLDSLRLVFSHIRHIRLLSINLWGRLSHLDDLLSPLKLDPPDILEELRLSSFDPSGPTHFSSPFKIAPNLRRSELRSCYTDWKLFYSIGDLTSLVLRDIPVSSRPSIDDILSIFQSMSKLETLELIHALPELPPAVRTLPPPQDIVPVRLEFLSHLSLRGFVLDCANLMRYFVMPRCRRVNLETKARWPLREIVLAVSPLSSIISSIFSESDEHEMHYVGWIRQRGGGDDKIAILFFPASPHTCLDAGYTFILAWCGSYRRDIMDTSPGFGSLLLALPLSRVTVFHATLESKEDEHIDNAEWLRVEVKLKGGYTYGFVNAFHEAHASLLLPSNGPDTAVVPGLASLTIMLAHFSLPLGDNQLFSTFMRFLSLRQQLQLPVPKITTGGCEWFNAEHC
ncbi:hypothetical protein EDB85DRAFT_1968250 [Lactarius pseudohatsudake]|nr:hypothetical protein EDB85DRAFT_1968250 [Lactarius pseudohatsudake]